MKKVMFAALIPLLIALQPDTNAQTPSGSAVIPSLQWSITTGGDDDYVSDTIDNLSHVCLINHTVETLLATSLLCMTNIASELQATEINYPNYSLYNHDP